MGRKPSADRPKPVGLPGLRARAVRGPRDGQWYWRAERRDKSVAWTGWATREQVGGIIADLVAGGHAVVQVQPEDSFIDTLDELTRAWMAHLEDHRPDLAESSVVQYRVRIRAIRQAGCAGYQLERMDTASMEAAKADLLRRFSPRTAYACLQLIRSAWRWGRREGLVPDRELLIPEVRIERKAKRVPGREEIRKVAEQFDGWRAVAIRFLWGTGCRVGELGVLTWDQVDLERGEVVLTGKTGSRLVPLGTELLQRLRAWHREQGEPLDGYMLGVMPNTARLINRHLQGACERAKVRPFTCHALRRAAVDSLARSGVDVSTAAALLGHTPEVMLEYYRQVTHADLRDAVRRASLGQEPTGDVVEFPRGRRG